MKSSHVLFLGLLAVSASAAASPNPPDAPSPNAPPPGLVTSSSPGVDDISPVEPLPPGVLSSSQHSDEWKIRNALSAAPAAIAEKAAVQDWPPDFKVDHPMGRVLRPGTNGWTCLPDTPGKPQHDPMCADETMMKWMMATMAGRKPNIDRVGLSYMLLGEAGANQNDISAKKPPPGKDWYYVGPHVMIVLPDADKDALRDVNQDISNNTAYVTALKSSSPLWVIPVAKAHERVKAYKPGEAFEQGK
jgi:hypothetical protein